MGCVELKVATLPSLLVVSALSSEIGAKEATTRANPRVRAPKRRVI
jgi:hypothetical protein